MRRCPATSDPSQPASPVRAVISKEPQNNKNACSANGRTVADMLAHGFTNAALDGLVRDGLATIQPAVMRAGKRRITIVRVAITDEGHRALAGEAPSRKQMLAAGLGLNSPSSRTALDPEASYFAWPALFAVAAVCRAARSSKERGPPHGE
jgi:hypothetical protein